MSMKYKAKPVVVDAFRIESAKDKDFSKCKVPTVIGDYVITDENGNQHAFDPKVFEMFWEKVIEHGEDDLAVLNREPDLIDKTYKKIYKKIYEFIKEYSYWDDSHGDPCLVVPLYRVLDAITQRGEPYSAV